MNWDRIVFIFLGLVFIASIVFVFQFGLKPKPIPQLKASSFNKKEEVGSVIFERTRQRVSQSRLIVLSEDQTLWSRFVIKAQKMGFRQLPDVENLSDDLVSEIQKGKRYILFLPSEKIVTGSNNQFPSQLEAKLAGLYLRFGQFDFLQKKWEISGCDQLKFNGTVQERVQCWQNYVYIKYKSKFKKLNWDQTVAAMEIFGPTEYLVFLHSN